MKKNPPRKIAQTGRDNSLFGVPANVWFSLLNPKNISIVVAIFVLVIIAVVTSVASIKSSSRISGLQPMYSSAFSDQWGFGSSDQLDACSPAIYGVQGYDDYGYNSQVAVNGEYAILYGDCLENSDLVYGPGNSEIVYRSNNQINVSLNLGYPGNVAFVLQDRYSGKVSNTVFFEVSCKPLITGIQGYVDGLYTNFIPSDGYMVVYGECLNDTTLAYGPFDSYVDYSSYNQVNIKLNNVTPGEYGISLYSSKTRYSSNTETAFVKNKY
jgi:hypothetical protein